jgi:hypothetical protein
MTINPGDFIKTKNNNRLLIELVNGNSFRLDENTLVQIVNKNEIQLKQGKIYIESNKSSSLNQLLIKTKLGSINHIGTRYLVEYNDRQLNVGVREGKVVVDNVNQHKEVSKGFALTINENGSYTSSKILPNQLNWQWTQKIAKQFNIQGKTVSEYLNWVSSETGYPIKWLLNRDKIDASLIKLSGSINGVMPLESLDVLLPTTRFNYSISDSAIHISS